MVSFVVVGRQRTGNDPDRCEYEWTGVRSVHGSRQA